MKLPKKVSRGEEVTAEVFNALIDAIQANIIKPGPGYQRKISKGGTSLRISPPSRPLVETDHPPFAMIELEEVTLGGWEMTLEPGRVRSANPVQAANDGDGYDYFVPEIAGVPMNQRDVDGNLPTIAISDGEWIYCRIERDVEGVVIPPCEIVVDVAEKKSAHYQPVNPDDSGVEEIDQYARILQFDIVTGEPEITVWRESDIDVNPFQWAGENLGSGARPFKKHEDTTGRWQFRTDVGCYGITAAEVGDEIIFDFKAENTSPTGGEATADVYVEPTEAELLTCPKAKFRPLTQGPSGRKEIEVVQSATSIAVMGNDVTGSLVFLDCGGATIHTHSWVDGLVTTTGATLTLGDCPT